MDHARIDSADPQVSRFVEEFLSPAPTIAAQSSGSTGVPKEITLHKSDMRLSARATNAFFGIDATSTLVCPLSINYIAAKMMVVRAIESGAKLMMPTPANAWRFTGHKATLVAVVPSQIPALENVNTRHVIVGGSPCSEAQETLLRSMSLQAWATFGMTETCSHVALRSISHSEPHYTALPGYRFETDPEGCLRIINPAMSWQSLQTNDVVNLLNNSRFIWLGRRDNVINSGGIKLHPEQLEQRVKPLLPSNMEFYFTSRTSQRWGQEMVAIVCGADTDTTSLTQACQRRLSPYEQPKAYLTDLSPTRTSSGKLIRKRL